MKRPKPPAKATTAKEVSPLRIALSLVLISALSLFPSYIYDIGGDRLVHAYYIRCFADDFWRGVLYPRWCMEASGGLGTPAFMFYFPLPYWGASLLYPLTWAGLSLDALQQVLFSSLTFFAACTCYYWLRTYVSHLAALAGSLLYLLTPYHAELVLYRSAYTELWLFAFLPLLMMQARALAVGTPGAWLKLAVIYALCLMSHASTALMAGFAVALYLGVAFLQARGQEKRQVARGIMLAASGALLAFAVTSFYWLPGMYYRQFTVPRGPDLPYPVVDIYPKLLTGFRTGFNDRNPLRLYNGTVFTLVMLVGFAIAVWRFARRGGAGPLRSELIRFSVICVVAFLLYVPLLEPLWLKSDVMQALIFPWRFQLLWVPLLALFAAFFVDASQRGIFKARIGDGVVLVGMLILFSFSLVYYIMPNQDEKMIVYNRAMNMSVFPYAPKWTAMEYGRLEVIIQQMDNPRIVSQPKGADISVVKWQTGTIELDVDSPRGGPLTLRHLYFPAWRGMVTDPKGVTAALPLTHNDKGLMYMQLPPGKLRVTLRFAPYKAMAERVSTGCTEQDVERPTARSGC